MFRLAVMAPALMALIGLLSCGGANNSGEEIGPLVEHPAALIADQIIEGTILGEELVSPYGITVDFRGNVYVTDAGSNRLISFDPLMNPLEDIGGYGSGPTRFNRPGYLAVDNGLTLLIADQGNARLTYYNSSLTYVDEISLADVEDLSAYGEPSGVALTGYSEVWMADRAKDRVVIFDNTGRFDRFLAEFGYSGGQVSSPEAIVSDGRGEFIICDAGNGRLLRYDAFGNYVRSIGEKKLGYPVSAAVDSTGRYWVVDGESSSITCLSPRGIVLFETGPQMTGLPSSMQGLTDIAILRDGRLLIADSGRGRLIICRPVFESD